MGRKIESEREARRYLRAAKAAGQAVGAWAREHGIVGSAESKVQIDGATFASLLAGIDFTAARGGWFRRLPSA